jgi:hypothetical protein
MLKVFQSCWQFALESSNKLGSCRECGLGQPLPSDNKDCRSVAALLCILSGSSAIR